jgi:hypothetical protein
VTGVQTCALPISALSTTRPASDPGYDTYLLYDRAYERSDNLGGGGRRTEVRVYPAGALPAQRFPNDLGA